MSFSTTFETITKTVAATYTATPPGVRTAIYSLIFAGLQASGHVNVVAWIKDPTTAAQATTLIVTGMAFIAGAQKGLKG